MALVVVTTYGVCPWIPLRSGYWSPLSASNWASAQEWIRDYGGEANGAIGGVEVDHTFGRQVSQIYGFPSAESSMDERVPHALVVELGIPLRWVAGWRVEQSDGEAELIDAVDGSWAPRWTRWTGGIMPMRIMWLEFAVNVASASALVGVLVIGAGYLRVLRSRYRRRIGSCGVCGYPLQGAPQCPECGSEGLVG